MRIEWDGAPWGRATLNLLFPQFCRACHARLLTNENGYFCPACWENSPGIEAPFCPGCARPHPQALGFASRENFLCGDCRATRHATRFMVAAARYDGPVAEAIKLLKFHGKTRLAAPLAARMGEAAHTWLRLDTYTHLTPVPLYPVRQRARGFNQSLLLARELAAHLPNGALDQRLRRIRPTRTQSHLHEPAARRANVRGAFAATGSDWREARVLLIDDVTTTGGTVQECARALRRAGAAEVDVLLAAVSVPPEPALM